MPQLDSLMQAFCFAGGLGCGAAAGIVEKSSCWELKGLTNPEKTFMAQDWAMCLVVKGECPVVWVCCVVDPGKSRVSVGVDCSVSRPPSVSPRRL